MCRNPDDLYPSGRSSMHTVLIIIPVVNSSSVLWILSERVTGKNAVSPPIPVPIIPVTRPASAIDRRLLFNRNVLFISTTPPLSVPIIYMKRGTKKEFTRREFFIVFMLLFYFFLSIKYEGAFKGFLLYAFVTFFAVFIFLISLLYSD